MTADRRKYVLEELNKCEVVCANCHSLRTFNRNKADRMAFLTTPEELQEVDIVVKALSCNGPLKLKRTFNQSDFQGGYIKFWRVMSPWHPNYGSDIGLMWLKEKGFIKHDN